MSYPRDLEVEPTSPAASRLSAQGTEPAPSGPSDVRSDRRVNLFAWLFVIALLLVQFGMFRQFALREVVWSYPTNRDQDTYLFESYIAYRDILDVGVGRGLKQAIGKIGRAHV